MKVALSLSGKDLRGEVRGREVPGGGEQAVFAVERVNGLAVRLAAVVQAVLRGGEGRVLAAHARGTAGGTLRDDAQRNRFLATQFRRGFAEVETGRRTDALDVVAVGREVQVSFEEFRLGVVALQFQGAEHLEELAVERASPQTETQAGQLHGNR